MSRDLLAALWPASFKGVPFYTERDEAEGGRRLVVSEFPYSDEPFVEDLGQRAKRYQVTAYVVGDAYDAAAAALASALDGGGAGVLVLPLEGPVTAWCERFRREREKDRTGFIAFSAEFVRDGAATPLVSVDYTAQLALDTVANAATAGASLAAQADVVGAPQWVADGAVAGLQDAVAALDAIRTTASVDPVSSLAIGDQLATLYNALPTLVSNVTGLDALIVPGLFSAAQALGAAIAPAQAAAAFAQASDATAQPALSTTTANQALATGNAAAIARLTRLALLSAYLAAVVNATYASRPDGIDAKVRLVFRFDVELGLCLGAPDEQVYIALQDMRNAGVAYLDALITTLAPIVTVTTPVYTPSLVIAWALYQDPTRAGELVARNGVRHPSYMPLRIEAVAPSA